MDVTPGVLPLTAACLLHKSHREAYNDADVKVTYALFVCGPLLEFFSVYYLFFVNLVSKATWLTKKVVQKPTPVWTGMVAQYSLIGYFTTGYIASLMECIDQQVSMTPCCSSRSITKWVLQHLKYGWMQYIDNTAGYWKFNDQRGQGTLEHHHECNEALRWSIKGPLDESVLLWHMATDICFYSSLGHACTFAEDVPTSSGFREKLLKLLEDDSSPSHQTRPQCGASRYQCLAVQSRVLSNYMTCLLFIKPDMLLPGSRRNVFTTAYDELKDILKDKPACMVIPRSIRIC
jgi:hypothetical protein